MKKVKFDYKWVIVALSFLMIMVTLGFCSSNRSIYIVAITKALGISRSAFSLTETLRYVFTAGINIFFSALLYKFGTKKLIFAGFSCLIIAMVLYATAQNVILFYVGSCLLGIGFSFTSTTMVSSVINTWCKQNKGTIMGAVLAANGLGAAIATQIVSPIIYRKNDTFGYRKAYWLIVVILAVTTVIVMLFFKERPKVTESGEAVTPKKAQKSKGNWVGVEYSFAKKKGYYYVTLFCVSISGFVLQSITGVSAAHMSDIGIADSFIAIVVSVHSIALAASKFITGRIYDKFGLKANVAICCSSAVAAVVLLMVANNSATGNVVAMSYAIISALAVPLETVMLPIYVCELFGQKSFDKLLGIFVAVNMAGYAFGSPAINAVYDLMGSYVPAFAVCAVLMVGVLVAMMLCIHSAKKVQNEIESMSQA